MGARGAVGALSGSEDEKEKKKMSFVFTIFFIEMIRGADFARKTARTPCDARQCIL